LLRENRVISLHPVRVREMKGEQLPVHGGVWKAEFDVALDAAQQRRVVVLE
jgi:hypothetical protein